jgi:cysteinyl-tRNA synthetase
MKHILMIMMAFTVISGCSSTDTSGRNYRQDMRLFVQEISETAKALDSNFIIIPQNGHELLTGNGEANGTVMTEYLNSLDGIGREDLFYGYLEDDLPTPESETDSMIAFMDLAEDQGVQVLVTDYCWTQTHVDDSYEKNSTRGYISFAASHRELDNIPDYPAFPYHNNNLPVTFLREARNFLYLLNPDTFSGKENFLTALRNTDHDLIIMDLFYQDDTSYNPGEIESLKVKAHGGRRLVIAYMSIGEAENYRYYWKPEWEDSLPQWIKEENQDWPGNFIVRYWEEEWKEIIFKNEDSYLKKIMDAGFDGVYLDIIDAYEYYEDEGN